MREVSVRLSNAKRSIARRLKRPEQQLPHAPLPNVAQTPAPAEPPPDIASWFADLALLRGVPFNYLVPDPSMLPAESIRFFRLDGLWVDCLLDGAFSVGRVTRTDYEQTQVMKESLTGGGDEDKVTSGFLLRSSVV